MTAGRANDEPTVSVVIPTVGLPRRVQLERTVRALGANLSPGDSIEVVVVLDGGAASDLDWLGVHDVAPLVLAVPKGGPAAARNAGWRAASGEVVAFLDDDAAPGEAWLADVRRAFAADPGLAGLGGRVEPLWPRNIVSRTLADQGHIDHAEGPSGVRLIGANMAFRRSALEAVGGFDERLPLAAGEDFELCERMTRAGLRLQVTRAARVYHWHPTTVGGFLATCRRYRAGSVSAGPPAPDPAVVATTEVAGAAPTGLRRLYAGTVDPVLHAGSRARRRLGPGAVGDTVERAAWMFAHAPGARGSFRTARHLGAGVPTAVAESFLQLLWLAEWSRPGAVGPDGGPDPTS